MKTIPWEKAFALARKIRHEGKPREIHELDRLIEAETRNCEALYVLFGRQVCMGAVERVVALRMEKDAAYGRLAMEMRG